MTTESDGVDADERRPSKSARKREADSLQDLGVELAGLPEAEIASLDLPETLYAALSDLKRLTSHGAQVRQRQYIGKLMRRIDPAPVLAKLAERKQQHDEEIRHFQQIERWRDRLLAQAASALEELAAEYPHTDRAAVKRLVEQAVRERAEDRPPAASRALFTYLRRLLA